MYLLAALVFTTTTGLSVHRLVCYCKGEMVASLLRPADPCEKADSASKNCCKAGPCGMAQKDGKKTRDCSDCAYQYVKLDVKYLPSFLDLKLSLPAVPARLLPLFANERHLEKNTVAWERDIPPPPAAGRALLSLIQSYLC